MCTRVRAMRSMAALVLAAALALPAALRAAEEAERPRDRDREGREQPDARQDREGRGEREGRDARQERGEREAPRDRPPEPREPRDRVMNGDTIIVEAIERRVPAERRKAVELFIADHLSPEVVRIRKLAADRPDEAHRRAERLVGSAMDLSGLQRERPGEFVRAMDEARERWELDDVAETCRTAEGKAREQARAKLREGLVKLFDRRQEQVREQIGRMEKELAEQKAHLEKRQANREALIDRRVAEMTGELDGMEW